MDFCAGKVRQACGLWELQPAQRAVLVLRGAGDILTEPAWRLEGIGSRFIRKFDLGKDHAVQITGEKVQLDVQAAVQGDDIAVLGDQMSVRFFDQVGICLAGKRQVVFFPDQKAL